MKTSWTRREFYELTSAYWFKKFREALCEKKFKTAKKYFDLHKHWVARIKLTQLLDDVTKKAQRKWECSHHGK